MPIYEYRCEDCMKIFERLIPTMSNRKEKCPWCGELCEKIMSQSSFHLDNTKGLGWAKDGYNRHGSVFTDREKKSSKTNLKLEPDKDHSKDKKPKLKVK